MDSSEKKLISVRNLSFKYHNDLILDNINFDILKGRNVAILGRNGGGKSTLIKVLLNFLKKKSGTVEFFIDRSKVGYLPQIREFDATFPINIFDLVISGLTDKKNLFRRFNEKEKEKTGKLLTEFGIFHLKHKLISEVSGGQLQRALIARALISSPEIIFLDEPESFLDKEFEFRLFEKIKQLTDSTLVIISHELEKVYNYVDSIFIVEGNIKIYKNKTEYYKNENMNMHKH
ncbi:MAG: metal ABC transporter ATP-binding protein [Leptotrichiaceae bacterium]|nr:metal ABC transporter ATP-binding protein [Leptotrichiaceae bacterium]